MFWCVGPTQSVHRIGEQRNLFTVSESERARWYGFYGKKKRERGTATLVRREGVIKSGVVRLERKKKTSESDVRL